MKRTAIAAALLVPLLFVGCSSPGQSPEPQPTTTASAAAPTQAQGFLERHGLAGLSAEQIVDQLDRTNDDRGQGLTGSVTPSELLLSDAQEQVSLPLPQDKFYLSLAPYVNTTHPCFNHNLATCQGELANTAVEVQLVDASGTTMVDEQLTTYDNGFVGIWLPKDMTGELTVRAEGKSATTQISTSEDDGTCLTTLQLM